MKVAESGPAREARAKVDWVLVVLGVATVLSAGWIMVGPAPATVSWASQTVLLGVFVWFSWRIARKPQTPPLVRRFWRAATVGGLLFTFGGLLQTVESFGHAQDRATSTAAPDLLMAIGVGCVVWSMLTHPLDVTGRERLRLWLDAATVVCGVAVFTWSVSVSRGAMPTTSTELGVAMVGSGLMLATGFAMVRMLLAGSAPFTAAAGLLSGAATALFGTAAALNALIAQAQDVRPIMAAKLLPCLLLAMTPRVQQLRTRVARPAVRRRGRAVYTRLPFIAAGATLILLVMQLWHEGLSARSWGTVVGTVVIVLLVMVRQTVAMADNAQLLQQLDHSMMDLRRMEQRFRSLVQNASDITMLINAQGIVAYVSPALRRVLGEPPEQAVGRPAIDVLRPDDRPTVERLVTQLIEDRSGSATVQLQVRHADGSCRWLEMVATSLLDDTSVSGIIANIRDITEAKLLQDRLRYDASHDSLTGLPNRALLNERAELFHESPAQPSDSKAVLLLDLDDFKAVNDILGHHMGDQLLVVVADRLRGNVRPTDTVARLGGDEFAVLMTGASQSAAVSSARRILGALSETITIEGHALAAPASIGVAVGSRPFDTMLRDADAAMYEAKRNQSGIHLYVGGSSAPKSAVSVSEPDQ